ncbi:MAG: hypothetical protein ACREKM_09070 [Longimicrobiales bacterium]
MSRAFVKEDGAEPPRRFALPARRDPSYPKASALALLEAACDGETSLAEDATGYRWGDPQLKPHVERLLEQELALPDDERNDRFVQVARRYLRAAVNG